MTHQRTLDFQPGGDSEAKRDRCRRLLAGIPKTTTAARLFDAQAHAEAEARCQAVEDALLAARIEEAWGEHSNETQSPAKILFNTPQRKST